MKINLIIIIGIIFLISCTALQKDKAVEIKYHDLDLTAIDTNDYLIRKSPDDPYYELGSPFAYINQKGDTVIPINEFYGTRTDTFRAFAIVKKDSLPWIGIDRNENLLFEVFYFDNGPDYIEEGLFRVIRNGKIGYANAQGEVVIPCQFDCAYYFENGKAKVSKDCKEIKDFEHTRWESDSWYYIDKAGNRIE